MITEAQITDGINRLADIARGDHDRGCPGREYSCDCGYDARNIETVVEVTALILELATERDEAQRALVKTTASLAGAASAYEKYAGPKRRGPDPFFNIKKLSYCQA